MEIYFLILLIITMAAALGSGYPVAFALPGAAIVSIGAAALAGWLFAGSASAYFHSGGPLQWLSAGITNQRGVYLNVERDTLIAIPLFIFMGIMLQRSKIAEDLLVTMAQLFGPVPGGLGISVVFVGALLAATTGIVGATVVAMGLISLPAMLRNKYSPSLATGTIAASGTLGQIIPPSIVLIILADQLASAADQASTLRKALYKAATGELSMPSIYDVAGTSAGEMFLGALVPGLVLVGLYMAYILIYALLRPKAAPAVPYEGSYDRAFWGKVLITLVPPLALIFLVLGSILTGVATVNQAGAIGAAGALIMASYRLPEPGTRGAYWPALLAIASLGVLAYALQNYNMNVKAIETAADRTGILIGAIGATMLLAALAWSALRIYRIDNTLNGVMLDTAKTTSLVFIILLGAAMLTAAFRAFGGEELVREFLIGVPGGFWSQFFLVMAVIFVLGFFLDFIEISVVVVPIVAPILLADPGANVTAVWLGVMIGLNIQTSFLTPPFGFALFYLRGVAPAVVKTVQMYKGVVAFILLQLTALFIVGSYPPLANYLPDRVSFLSENSPPPRNPKLQLCLEDYVSEQLAASPATREAIDRALKIDLSVLPKDVARNLQGAFKAAAKAVDLLDQVHQADARVAAAAVDYRPLREKVRELEKLIRHEELLLKDAKTKLSRIQANDAEQQIARAELEREIAAHEARIEALRAEIPANWEEAHKEFAALTKAEDTLRRKYRRAADTAWEAPAEFVTMISQNPEFDALGGELVALRPMIEAGDPKQAMDAIKALSSKFSALAGPGDVRSALSKARRALKGNNPDRAKALAAYEAALAAYQEQKAWRAAAEKTVAPGVEAYLDAIRGTLGVRSQPRLTREQALWMASCMAHHRDISLNF